jgi:hypothetical protein
LPPTLLFNLLDVFVLTRIALPLIKKNKKIKKRRIALPTGFFAPSIALFSFFAPTNPGGAQALSKEFPVSAPRVIQGATKFPQSNGPKGLNAPKRC